MGWQIFDQPNDLNFEFSIYALAEQCEVNVSKSPVTTTPLSCGAMGMVEMTKTVDAIIGTRFIVTTTSIATVTTTSIGVATTVLSTVSTVLTLVSTYTVPPASPAPGHTTGTYTMYATTTGNCVSVGF